MISIAIHDTWMSICICVVVVTSLMESSQWVLVGVSGIFAFQCDREF